MSDSGLHPNNATGPKISLVVARLFLAFTAMWTLSFACYVIFAHKLTHVYTLQSQHRHVIDQTKNTVNLIEEGMQHTISFLQSRIFIENLSPAEWEKIKEKSINQPLDSLRTAIAAWDHPEGKLIYTALRLSFHTYNKLLNEAYFMSEDTAYTLREKSGAATAFMAAKKIAAQKITGDILPQATEISQQIQDLRSLLEADAVLQQQAVADETSEFYTVAAVLFVSGILAVGLLAFLWARWLLPIPQNTAAKLTAPFRKPQPAAFKASDSNISAVLNTTENGILALDMQFKVTVINQALRDKFAGKGIDLKIGSDYSEVFSDVNYDWKAPFRKAFAGENVMELNHQADTDTYIETSYSPIKDARETVVGVSLFIQDVSEHKRKEIQIKRLLEESDLHSKRLVAQETILLDTLREMQESQEALQHKEARLSAVINNTDDRILAIDTDFKITVINAAMQEKCSQKGIQLDVGTDYRVIYKGMDEKLWLPDFKRAFAGEKFVIEQTPDILKSGVLEIAFNPITNQKGVVTGVCLFIHDITERVNEAEEKQRLYLAAQETTEELQTQQEELRQNLEELMSTQEELEKTQKNILLKEARLRALITNTTDAIFSIDTRYVVTVINEAMQDLYQRRYVPIKEGDHFLKSLPAGKQQLWKDFFNRALAGEQYTTVWEDTFYAKSVYHEMSFNPVKTDHEEIVGVSVFISDITERKNQETERLDLLRQAEERQEELMSQQEMLRDNLQELMLARDELEAKEAQLSSQINAINKSNNILELDLNGNILDANDSFLNLVGYSKDELAGNSYQILIPEDEYNSDANQLLWRKLMNGEFYTVECKRITKEKACIWIKATYNPVLNAQGKPYKILNIASDITARVQDATEKKRLYEQISRDAEELRMQEEELRQNLEELKVTQEALLLQKEHIYEKEARLRALIDNTEDDIYAIDTKYTVTVLNKAVQARYAKKGLTLELGYNIFSIIPKTNTAYWKVNFDKAMGGEKFSIVDQVVTNEGEIFYDVSFNPIRNDKNQVIGVSVLSRNINQYKMAEKENLQTIDILRKIQDKVASMNNDREKEIEDYKKKVERLRKEMNGTAMN